MLERVVALAQPREVAGFGGSAERSVVCVVQVQFPGLDAAAGETASGVPGCEEPFETFAGSVSVH